MDATINPLRVWLAYLAYGALLIVAILIFLHYLQASFHAYTIVTLSTPPDTSKAANADTRVRQFEYQLSTPPDTSKAVNAVSPGVGGPTKPRIEPDNG